MGFDARVAERAVDEAVAIALFRGSMFVMAANSDGERAARRGVPQVVLE
jgi:hypothetical protein